MWCATGSCGMFLGSSGVVNRDRGRVRSDVAALQCQKMRMYRYNDGRPGILDTDRR